MTVLVWLVFLGDGKTLAASDEKEKVSLWDLSGAKPQKVCAGKALDELTQQERDRLRAGVQAHPPGASLPDQSVYKGVPGMRAHPTGASLPERWRTAFLTWEYRLRARFSEAGVRVSREERDGKETTLLEWSPPGDVLRMQFSGDGRHLIVSYRDGTVHVVRLDPDGRLLSACDAMPAREPNDVNALLERARVRLRRGEQRAMIAASGRITAGLPSDAKFSSPRCLGR